MKTIIIQIGNSDDKLTQKEWSEFVRKVDKAISHAKTRPHFSGGSYNDAPWQNYCWVFQLHQDSWEDGILYQQLLSIRKEFKQDSLAWTEGITAFI